VVGYFSHIDTDLEAAAQSHGVVTVRRGRFWSSLDQYLT